jgi:hypothetical protein
MKKLTCSIKSVSPSTVFSDRVGLNMLGRKFTKGADGCPQLKKSIRGTVQAACVSLTNQRETIMS